MMANMDGINFERPMLDPIALYGVLGKITLALVPTTEADPVGIYASLVSGVGAIIGRNPHIMIDNTRHPMIFNVLLLGPTGIGRKGTATNNCELVLRLAFPDDLLNIRESGLSSGEGLIGRIANVETIFDKENKPIGQVGTDDKRLWVVETEFQTVMARCARPGNTLSQYVRMTFEGIDMSVLNRKRLVATSPHVVIIAHITDDEFKVRSSNIELAGGTYNRFLPIYTERLQRIDREKGKRLDTSALERLAAELRGCVSRAQRIGEVDLDDEAEKLWNIELYPELSAGSDVLSARQFTERSAAYCLRLASLYAAMDGRSLVNSDELQAAAALVRYSRETAEFIMAGIVVDPKIAKALRLLKLAPTRSLSRTELSRQVFGANSDKDELDEFVKELLATGEVSEVKVPTAGRSRTEYRLI